MESGEDAKYEQKSFFSTFVFWLLFDLVKGFSKLNGSSFGLN